MLDAPPARQYKCAVHYIFYAPFISLPLNHSRFSAPFRSTWISLCSLRCHKKAMDLSTISNVVIKLMKEVIEDDESRHILETDLTPMECLLRYITTDFKDRLPEAARETMKIWLQLLHNCLTHAKSLLHRSQQQRQRYLDCLMYCNPGKLSKEVKEWKLLFYCIFQGFHRDVSVFASAAEVVIAPVIAPVIPLMKDVIQGEQIPHILQTELSPMDILLLDISTVFQDEQKAGPENLKIWLQLLQNSLTRATSILHTSELRQRQQSVDCVIRNPGRLSKQIEEWKVLFNYIFEGLQKDFLVFLTSPEVVISPFIARVIPVMEDVIQEEEKRHILQTELRPMLNLLLDMSAVFSQDQQTAGPRILKLRLQRLHDYLAQAKTILDLMSSPGRVSIKDINEWKELFDCLFQDLQRDFSIFVTARQIIHITDPIPALSAEGPEQLYQRYEALPTSDLKNCFLSCAIYAKGEQINVEHLVQMWIAEGLVRSKHESHLMDMAIARTYVNLLLDRRFFHNATNEEIQYYSGWDSSDRQRIRVDGDIRELAMNIAEKEQNCLFKAGQGIQNFPTVHTEDCDRISLQVNQIENLPSELPACPKLVSLILSHNRISVVPSGFLVGLTSLKVLDLSENKKISSIPSSVGQLQQLQLLRLEGLDNLNHLPEEIGHLSSLQFLSLKACISLESLPSQIGQLQNLKYLNICRCHDLRVIPHEISQLTSLTILDAWNVELSVEAESERSICRLKGLINLTMVRINVKEGNTSSGIEGSIMGTWLDMRHLSLDFGYSRDDVMDNLPDDMQNMRKLQRLEMWYYRGLSLPEYSCKFQHLQHLELYRCWYLKELSPLERLPSLTYLKLCDCPNLKELGIFGKASGGFLMLEELVLNYLEKLESMAGPSNHGVWNERTLSKLRILKIRNCPNLKRLPVGMDKLLNLKTIKAQSNWWQQIIWENDSKRLHFENIFKEWEV